MPYVFLYLAFEQEEAAFHKIMYVNLKCLYKFISKEEKIMKYFGTDGIRLNDKQKLEILTIKFAYALHKFNAKQVVLGHDGRPNSKRFKNKLKNALLTLGISTLDCGLVPSSFVSYYTVKHKANFGVVITASHNSADTNGIKTFNSNGEKLKVSQEKKIEKFFDELFDKDLTAQLKCIAKKHGIKKEKT